MSPERAPGSALDLRALFATLAAHGVDYVVIGGIAVQVHGHRRTTKDLDLVPRPEAGNFESLAAALAELGARPRDLPGVAPTAEHLARAPSVPPLTTVHGELHVLRDVPAHPPTTTSARARSSSTSMACPSRSRDSTTSSP